MSEPTSTTGRDVTAQVANDLVGVLDYLSRVCTAADGGNAGYLWDKTCELALVVQRLHGRLCTRLSDGRRSNHFDKSVRIDGQRLHALVTRDAHHYRAGRALYPAGSLAEAGGRQALRRAATLLEVGVALDELLGLTQQQVDAVAAWLRNQASTDGGASL